MQKINPCLWYDGNGEEAMNFYTSIFKNSKIIQVKRYGDGAPMPSGTMLMGRFEIEGQEYLALNGGPHFKFTGAISLVVNCETQAEIDDLWEQLSSDGGETMQCAWLKDKYGLHWQIVPTILGKLMSDPDKSKSQRVMAALLQMTKMDIAKLQEAYNG